MRKLICAGLAMILCAGSALALTGTGYPEYDAGTPVSESIGGTFDDSNISLQFDPKPEYSFISNGMVNACFFTYSTDNVYLLEMYLNIPESVAPGDIISPEYCRDHECYSCSISFMESASAEDYLTYAVFSYNGEGYPSGYDYQISIDSVSRDNGKLHVEGELSAKLAGFNGVDLTGTSLTIQNAHFAFTVDTLTSVPESSPVPFESPAPSPEPSMSPKMIEPSPYVFPDSTFSTETMPSPTPYAVKV